MNRVVLTFFTCLLLLESPWAVSQQISKEQIKGLDEQVQDIKKDVLAISTELNLLEEKLLFPSNTQVSLFVSLSNGRKIDLDSIEVKIDDKSIAHHIYTYKELNALREGGVQRVYTGNLRTGKHSLKVGFKGKSSLGGDFTEVASHNFSKGVGPGMVEIKLVGSSSIEFFNR